MIAAVYFKIQISRDLIDLPKESIRYEKASKKVSGQIKSKFSWVTEFLATQPNTVQQRPQIRFRLDSFYYFDHKFRYRFNFDDSRCFRKRT